MKKPIIEYEHGQQFYAEPCRDEVDIEALKRASIEHYIKTVNIFFNKLKL